MTNFWLLAITLISIMIGVAMLAVIVTQRQQISEMRERMRPKYGFLGKPITTMLLLAVTVAGLNAIWLTRGEPTTTTSSFVSDEIKLQLDFEIYDQGAGQYLFKLIPTNLAGELWQFSGTLDAYWTFFGPSEFSVERAGLSMTDHGDFTHALPSGTYQVRVDVLYQQKIYTVEQEIQL